MSSSWKASNLARRLVAESTLKIQPDMQQASTVALNNTQYKPEYTNEYDRIYRRYIKYINRIYTVFSVVVTSVLGIPFLKLT